MPRLTHAAILLGLFTLAAPAAHAQCQYEVTAVIEGPDCPAPFGNDRPVALSINENGAWAGYLVSCFGGHDRAAFWSPRDGLQTPTVPEAFRSRATDITNDGRIVGWQETSGVGRRAFIIDDGVYTRIDPLPGGNKTEAAAINESGRVVGTWGNISTGPIHAFYWDGAGPITDLGPLLGTSTSIGNDVNRDGAITGWTATGGTESFRAFVVQDSDVTHLPAIPGGITSHGAAINNLGYVVGGGGVKLGEETTLEAFLWNGRSFTRLGFLPGTTWSNAWDINDATQIVGYCDDRIGDGDTAPYLWQHGQMHNLRGLVDDPDVQLGITLAINNKGQIICSGTYKNNRAVMILSPVDDRTGDVNHDCTVNVFDLLLLLQEWAQPNSIADVDNDGVVDADDLIELILQWG